jgi:hypothetical protein
MMPNLLDSLKRLDAWDDPDLEDYFTKNAATSDLVGFESQRCLAVGLKGIGKTATFRYLTEFDRTADVVVGVTHRRYRFLLDKTSVSRSFSQSLFEDDLVMQALQMILYAKLGPKAGEKNLTAAERLCGSFRDKLKTAFASIGGVTFLGVGFTRLTPPSAQPSGLQLAAETSQALDVLRAICARGVKVRIVIDDPENIFQSGAALDAGLLGGLFAAALRLTEIIPNFKVIILIKTHIFYPVFKGMEEQDKFPDATVHLGWKREELLALLEKRIQWAGGGWSGHVEGSAEQAKELIRTGICANLRNGPRELLRWAELSTRSSSSGKLDRASIEASKGEMARYSLEALEAAFSDQYPHLGDVIRCLFRGFALTEFSREELVNHFERLLVGNDEMMQLRSALQWLAQLTPRTLPKILLESGSISLRLGKELVLPYEDQYDENRFRVADGLRLTPILADAIEGYRPRVGQRPARRALGRRRV